MTGFVGQLLGGTKPASVAMPSPAPQIDDATAKLNAEDAASRRQGRKTTILTSDSGLPNLGTTTARGQ